MDETRKRLVARIIRLETDLKAELEKANKDFIENPDPDGSKLEKWGAYNSALGDIKFMKASLAPDRFYKEVFGHEKGEEIPKATKEATNESTS